MTSQGVLFYDQPGVYEPTVGENMVVWNRNDDDPFVGVQVNSPEHARKIAAIVYTDDELEEINAEYADYMQDCDFNRRGGWQ